MKTKIALETKPLLHCCDLGWTMLREGRVNRDAQLQEKCGAQAPKPRTGLGVFSSACKAVLANSTAFRLCTFLRPDNTLTFLQEGCDYGNYGGGMTRAQAPQSRLLLGAWQDWTTRRFAKCCGGGMCVVVE